MENRNIQGFLKLFLNFKAFRRRDILQVNSSKGRRDIDACLNNLISVLCTHTDRECIDIAKGFKQHSLALHNRHSGFTADIAKA